MLSRLKTLYLRSPTEGPKIFSQKQNNSQKSSKRKKRDELSKKFKKERLIYGGDYRNIRIGRFARPIAWRHTMHFVLKSSQAVGSWSFKRHDQKIRYIIKKFADKNDIAIKDYANVCNHLHIHLHISQLKKYRAFIRAITSSIMMAVTGVSRWSTIRLTRKFWDLRPFSRIIVGAKAVATLIDYIKINQFQGKGYTRDQARFMVKFDWNTWEFRK